MRQAARKWADGAWRVPGAGPEGTVACTATAVQMHVPYVEVRSTTLGAHYSDSSRSAKQSWPAMLKIAIFGSGDSKASSSKGDNALQRE